MSGTVLSDLASSLADQSIKIVDLTHTLDPDFPVIILPPEFNQLPKPSETNKSTNVSNNEIKTLISSNENNDGDQVQNKKVNKNLKETLLEKIKKK